MSETSSHKRLAPGSPGSSSTPKAPTSSAKALLGDDGRTVISSRPPVADLDFHGQTPLESGSRWEGEQLGQFVLEKFVGGGGMGIVFRALDTTLNREVAVKVLSRDQSADEETLRRFRNEAQSAARLNHDNIARVFYVGEDRGVHYIVFEYIDGVNIRDLVQQRGPMALDEAISYTHQIAQALAHASHRSVIHRDIKPSNVLITPDGKAKLVDMGLARLNQLAPSSNDLTASGVTLGTFDYISPEQARDPRSADVRSDLYSLGCSFFFMLTGRPPFPEGTVLQKLLQHQADSPPDPRDLRGDLPAEVTHILARLLAKNPAQRYQEPSALIDDLAALAESQGMQLGALGSLWVAPRRRLGLGRWQHHLPWIVPLAALFLIVLALDFYWSARVPDATGAALVPPGPAKRIAPAPRIEETEPPRGAPSGPPVSQDSTPPIDSAPPIPPVDDSTGSAPSGTGQLRDLDWLKRLYEAARTRSPSAMPPTESQDAAPTSDDLDLSSEVSTSVPPPAAAPRDASPDAGNLLIVSDRADSGHYPNLHAAVSKAKSGDVIELRFDGRRSERRPLEISNLKLTIRAAEGFRPIVVFQPESDWTSKYRPVMVSVAGGQLVAGNVDWEFELPRNDPADWALFETRRAELIELTNCTLTVRGQQTYQSRAAMFDVKAPPGPPSMAMDPGAADDHVVRIHLQNCVARGEATFLRDNDLQSVRLDWDNGLLATSARLFVAEGNALQPRHEGRAELALRHVTAMVGAGLVLLTNSQEAPYQLVTEISCEDCILATGAVAPLVEQRGSDTIDQYLTRFEWRGQNNYFDGFEVFWRIMNSSGQAGSRQLDFDQWQNLWRGQAGTQTAGPNAVVWQRPPEADRPPHAHVPADYALDGTAATNAARGGAGDKLDAGMMAGYLPAPPASARDAEGLQRDP